MAIGFPVLGTIGATSTDTFAQDVEDPVQRTIGGGPTDQAPENRDTPHILERLPGAGLFDETVDLVFQRPGELPWVDAEDSQDLPFGSLSNPWGDPDFDRGGPKLWQLALIAGVVALTFGQLFNINLG